MRINPILIAILAAVMLIAMVSYNYIDVYGTTRVADQEVWGQFGDYFGGILNPIFALAAFLSALWSIRVQQREARIASKYLAQQTRIAQNQLESAALEKHGEELLHVIREIDSRLSGLLEIVVSPPGAPQTITIVQMVAEAQRIASVGGASHALDQFIHYSNTVGSVVEAPVREIKYLITKMREFLAHYSRLRTTNFAPILVYYADKSYQLMDMLEAVGGMPADTREFFATVGDHHS